MSRRRPRRCDLPRRRGEASQRRSRPCSGLQRKGHPGTELGEMRLVGGVLLLTISGLLLLMPILLKFGMAAAVLVALSAIWAVLMVIAGRLGATRRSLPLPARSETE